MLFSGKLHVAVGTDASHVYAKEETPVMNQEERLYMVHGCKSVERAELTDFINDEKVDQLDSILDRVAPQFFFVTEATHSMAKQEACDSRGIKYIVGATSKLGNKTYSSREMKASFSAVSLLDPLLVIQCGKHRSRSVSQL